jgi:two-component system nitrogen regulation response regulator NtrX
MFPTVLIVDDEPSILQTLSGLLSDEGFEVSTAANGYEALKIIDTESPDLVLLDIWMPGIDGIETLKEIKKDNPHIQVIIITGHGTIETAVRATKLGAFDLIEKPLSIDKVIVAINNALNFRRLEEENKYLRKKTLEKNSINGNSPRTIDLKQQPQDYRFKEKHCRRRPHRQLYFDNRRKWYRQRVGCPYHPSAKSASR